MSDVYIYHCVPLLLFLSPFRSSGQKNQKKQQEEKKAEASPTSEVNSSSPKHKGEGLMPRRHVQAGNVSPVAEML